MVNSRSTRNTKHEDREEHEDHEEHDARASSTLDIVSAGAIIGAFGREEAPIGPF